MVAEAAPAMSSRSLVVISSCAAARFSLSYFLLEAVHFGADPSRSAGWRSRGRREGHRRSQADERGGGNPNQTTFGPVQVERDEEDERNEQRGDHDTNHTALAEAQIKGQQR